MIHVKHKDFCGMNKKKPPIPIRYGGNIIRFIPWSGSEFTMYALNITNWTNYPVAVKMGKDGFYELSGDGTAITSVYADQRLLTKDDAWKFLTRFILPQTIRSLSGARIGFFCICLNAGFWLKWMITRSANSMTKSIASDLPKSDRSSYHPNEYQGSHTSDKTSFDTGKINMNKFDMLFLMLLFAIAFFLVILLTGCTAGPQPQPYPYYYQASPSDQLFRVGTALMQSDRGYR